MTYLSRPLHSLQTGRWFKLICGASYHHLPEIRNLALAYTLAGADCVDVAADPAVISTAREGLQMARSIVPEQFAEPADLPLLMVSLNDGEDPHFRKATLDPSLCPADCPRPCVSICPAQALNFSLGVAKFSSLLEQRCYGCGRCLPVCPIDQIGTRSQSASPQTIAPLVLAGVVQAIEIHTQVGRAAEFDRLWQQLAPLKPDLKLLAISCGDGEGLVEYLWHLWHRVSPPQDPLPCPLIWQTDGRPMSGDIGDGATRQTVKLGARVLAAHLPGYVQLAGGTNDHTVAKLANMGLLHPSQLVSSPAPPHRSQRYISGVAYGSFARVLFSPIQTQLEQLATHWLEESPVLLHKAVHLAHTLVDQIKFPLTLDPPPAPTDLSIPSPVPRC